jgi:sulfite reductase alpha subunit-like flavoprotein
MRVTVRAPKSLRVSRADAEILVDNTLYFGCRSAAKDAHYNAEWEALQSEQKLRYRNACSRDGPVGAKRTYVQDLILADKERVGRMIIDGAWVYISG